MDHVLQSAAQGAASTAGAHLAESLLGDSKPSIRLNGTPAALDIAQSVLRTLQDMISRRGVESPMQYELENSSNFLSCCRTAHITVTGSLISRSAVFSRFLMHYKKHYPGRLNAQQYNGDGLVIYLLQQVFAACDLLDFSTDAASANKQDLSTILQSLYTYILDCYSSTGALAYKKARHIVAIDRAFRAINHYYGVSSRPGCGQFGARIFGSSSLVVTLNTLSSELLSLLFATCAKRLPTQTFSVHNPIAGYMLQQELESILPGQGRNLRRWAFLSSPFFRTISNTLAFRLSSVRSSEDDDYLPVIAYIYQRDKTLPQLVEYNQQKCWTKCCSSGNQNRAQNPAEEVEAPSVNPVMLNKGVDKKAVKLIIEALHLSQFLEAIYIVFATRSYRISIYDRTAMLQILQAIDERILSLQSEYPDRFASTDAPVEQRYRRHHRGTNRVQCSGAREWQIKSAAGIERLETASSTSSVNISKFAAAFTICITPGAKADAFEKKHLYLYIHWLAIVLDNIESLTRSASYNPGNKKSGIISTIKNGIICSMAAIMHHIKPEEVGAEEQGAEEVGAEQGAAVIDQSATELGAAVTEQAGDLEGSEDGSTSQTTSSNVSDAAAEQKAERQAIRQLIDICELPISFIVSPDQSSLCCKPPKLKQIAPPALSAKKADISVKFTSTCDISAHEVDAEQNITSTMKHRTPEQWLRLVISPNEETYNLQYFCMRMAVLQNMATAALIKFSDEIGKELIDGGIMTPEGVIPNKF
jgi:hypothetical protein